MTTMPPPPPEQPGAPAPATRAETATAPVPKKRNLLGLIALIVAAVGFVFACIPGALIVGWVLLPIAFILGIVALFLRNTAKWQAVTAIIVSVVGTVVGVIVFATVVSSAFDESFGSGSEVTIEEPAAPGEAEGGADASDDAAAGEASVDLGTRENPLPIGTTFSSDEWEVTVNAVTLDATADVLANATFAEEPPAGHEYIVVDYTVTNLSDDAEGSQPVFVGVDYVTATGNAIDQLDATAVGYDTLDLLSTLYEGATASGTRTMLADSPAEGVLAFNPGFFADTVFVAIR